MASADTARMMGLTVLKTVEFCQHNAITEVALDRRKSGAEHFQTTAGGMLRSVGAAGDVESWTFDWIVVDDLLTDPYEIRSFARRDQAYKDLCSKFFSRVNPTGSTRFIFIGSRRHPDDAQARLLAQAKEAAPRDRWFYHWRPAILNEGTDREEALWPGSSEFDLDGLRAIRDEKIRNGVAWEWISTFQNDPTGAPDLLAFDPAWLRPDKVLYDFPREALPPAKFKMLTTDPSMGAGNELSDFFASLYLHITEDGTVFVDDLYLEVAKPDRIVPMVVDLVRRNQSMDLAPFESNAGGVYAAEIIRRTCDGMGLKFPVIFKQYGSKSADEKISRITLHLYDILANSRLRIRNCPMGRLLLSQLQQFPTGKIDGPDALATGIIVLKEIV